jgi:formate/nitrite transporter
MLENWGVVIVGNLLGSLFMAWLLYETRLWESGAVGEQAVRTATAKCSLAPWVAFTRGILCNWLVCLAVFMATAALDVASKMLACLVPITVFVASGFEHNVANMYFIPEGILVAGATGRAEPVLTWWSFAAANLLPVTAGNVVGGVVFVASAYWYIHLGRGKEAA